MFLTLSLGFFLLLDPRFRDDLRTSVGFDHYVDDLFSTVLHQGSRVPVSPLMIPFTFSVPLQSL